MLCQQEEGLAFKLKRRGDDLWEEAASRWGEVRSGGLQLEPRGGTKLPPADGRIFQDEENRVLKGKEAQRRRNEWWHGEGVVRQRAQTD